MNEVLLQASGENWHLYNGDCVEISKLIPSNSVHLSLFSPPYEGLYVYSDSIRDLGNSRNSGEFLKHFRYLVNEEYRITKPGRIVAVDCMNIPAMKERDGYIGLKDFRGDLIRLFQSAGFIFHSEHCMWKDPLLEAVRTKALGLMHKQLCKDSAMCRAGIPQYLLAFRKPGVNEERVFHENGLDYFIGENEPTEGTLQHERWRRYASPVWMDINFGNTLNHRTARGENDERHICPMSMDIIGRGIQLWSNPNDVVFDPFAGVGSTGYVALEMGRKSIGIELKESYFNQNKKNLESVVANKVESELTLF
jgi:DNA modification methylase